MRAHQTASAIVAAARGCLGAPFMPQGRDPRHGLDCAGLIITAYAAAGIDLAVPSDYSFPPAAGLLTDTLAQLGFTLAQAISPAALLLFRCGGAAQHLALAVPPTSMIHAYAPTGQVVETAIGSAWLPRLAGIYRYPGV